MTRDEMIHIPGLTGSVRELGSVDIDSLAESLAEFIDIAQSGIKQQGLRWAGDFEGVSDLRYSTNPKKTREEDFKDWINGTDLLQSIAKSFNIRDMGRVRMLMMAPKTTYSLHYDPDLWRVHIPLITNPDAFMFVDGKMWHLALGKAYLVKVGHHHLAVNAGNENRIHVVFDFCGNLV
jgi:Aspartyl/Asparaginyl beta-hydroxylase